MNIIASLLIGISLIAGSFFMRGGTYGGDEGEALGATSFPTSLDALTNPSATDKTNSPSHSTQHTNANDAIEAIQAKIGVDGSAVTSSLDYKLSGVTGSDKAASLIGSEVLTNKTLTAPTVNTGIFTNSTMSTTSSATTTLTGSTTVSGYVTLNLGSDATGDLFYRTATGHLARIGLGTANQVLTASSTTGLPYWSTASVGVSTGYGSGNSLSLSATAGQKLQIWAKGNTTDDGAGGAVRLYYGGVLVDFINSKVSNSQKDGFSLVYSTTTAATTTTIEVLNVPATASTIENVKITYSLF